MFSWPRLRPTPAEIMHESTRTHACTHAPPYPRSHTCTHTFPGPSSVLLTECACERNLQSTPHIGITWKFWWGMEFRQLPPSCSWHQGWLILKPSLTDWIHCRNSLKSCGANVEGEKKKTAKYCCGSINMQYMSSICTSICNMFSSTLQPRPALTSASGLSSRLILKPDPFPVPLDAV